MKEPKIQSIMSIDEGETIAGAWATPQIPGTGFYKLLAKKRVDGVIEWAHLIERENGTKEVLYRGNVESEEQLQKVVDAVNAALRHVFGPGTQLAIGTARFYSLDGREFPDTVH